MQGYNSENYIEFRIEIYVYSENSKTVIRYDKIETISNPEQYVLNNKEVADYMMKYMDEMQSDK